jgi:hypothetical protein
MDFDPMGFDTTDLDTMDMVALMLAGVGGYWR